MINGRCIQCGAIIPLQQLKYNFDQKRMKTKEEMKEEREEEFKHKELISGC